MAEDSAQERTEAATDKRKEDTRKKGQVPRSKELDTLVSLLAAGIGMLIFGKQIVGDINAILVESLIFNREAAFSEAVVSAQMLTVSKDFMLLVLPLFVLLASCALISPISLGGWNFNPASMLPKMERISPRKGIARIFSTKSLMEIAKSIGKFVLVAAVTIFVISSTLDDLYLLPLKSLSVAANESGTLFVKSFIAFSSVLILVAMMDVPFQLWSFGNQIKMTKQEIKDESKETDGRPEIKAAIRERQQEISRQRMMAEVPKADVIITNPTHYAIALRYDQSGTGAPRVVAKGRDLLAARIRELGRLHNITVFEAPPLARALYASTQLNEEIPGNLFMAVAQVLAYVFQLKKAAASGGSKPRAPRHLPVPQDYDAGLSRGGNN